MKQPEPTHILDLSGCDQLPPICARWKVRQIPLVKNPKGPGRADFDVVERLLPRRMLMERRQFAGPHLRDAPAGIYTATLPAGAVIEPIGTEVPHA